MVILSSIPKLDVFLIAEELHKKGMLTHLYTGFASAKVRAVNRFIKRQDREDVPKRMISDLWFIHLLRHFHQSSIYNEVFDRWVANRIKNRNDYKAVLAWSGMGEHTITAAKRMNRFTVLGRESCHITLQNQILSKEYSKYGIHYRVDDRITKKELREYAMADQLYVCSEFVKRSFLDQGFPEDKIFVSPIGVPKLFLPVQGVKKNPKFIIVFFGKMTVRKGLRYLFEALEKINLPAREYEAWFIGAAEPVILREFERRRKSNWHYKGFISQEDVPNVLSHADVGVFPSLEDGFAQVVPQQLACGVPVIVTSNTGSSDIIQDGLNGYVVPPFDSDSIAEKIESIYNDPQLLARLKHNAPRLNLDALTPFAVSKRFEDFFLKHVKV
jgi:glycosyltransferase involved in cell wall biosynthesis